MARRLIPLAGKGKGAELKALEAKYTSAPKSESKAVTGHAVKLQNIVDRILSITNNTGEATRFNLHQEIRKFVSPHYKHIIEKKICILKPLILSDFKRKYSSSYNHLKISFRQAYNNKFGDLLSSLIKKICVTELLDVDTFFVEMLSDCVMVENLKYTSSNKKEILDNSDDEDEGDIKSKTVCFSYFIGIIINTDISDERKQQFFNYVYQAIMNGGIMYEVITDIIFRNQTDPISMIHVIFGKFLLNNSINDNYREEYNETCLIIINDIFDATIFEATQKIRIVVFNSYMKYVPRVIGTEDSAYHAADSCIKQNLPIVFDHIMTEYKIDINLPYIEEKTMLLTAVEGGHFQMLAHMIKNYGADVNTENKEILNYVRA